MPDLKVVKIIAGQVQRRNDIEMTLNSDGTFRDGPVFVNGVNRAVQDFVKGMLTRLGSNYLARNYGTVIPSLLHSRSLGSVSSKLVEEIQFLLGYIGSFNLNEVPSERIDEIVNIKAKESTDTIELKTTLRVGSGETVGVTL